MDRAQSDLRICYREEAVFACADAVGSGMPIAMRWEREDKGRDERQTVYVTPVLDPEPDRAAEDHRPSIAHRDGRRTKWRRAIMARGAPASRRADLIGCARMFNSRARR
jgi:hypothetical protein